MRCLIAAFAAVTISTSCACTKKPAPPEVSSPDEGDRSSHRATALRVFIGDADLSGSFVDGSRIVSRRTSGAVEHIGDGLIWLGYGLAGLPCDIADPLERAAAAQLLSDGGNLSRHPLRPDDASLDGALGLYLGVVERASRCGTAAVWTDAMASHIALVERTGGLLNERGTARMPGPFRTVMRLAARTAGVNLAAPSEQELGALEAAVNGWAKAVQTSYTAWKVAPGKLDPPACFRLHLGWIALRTMEKAGESVSNAGRASFCESVDFANLPVVDHWCGRGDLLEWVHSFRFDEWEVRHQRCAEYEAPDGAPDLHTPALDKLIAEREQFENL